MKKYFSVTVITLLVFTFTFHTSPRIILAKFAEWSLANDIQGLEASHDLNAMVRRSRLKFDDLAYTPKLK